MIINFYPNYEFTWLDNLLPVFNLLKGDPSKIDPFPYTNPASNGD